MEYRDNRATEKVKTAAEANSPLGGVRDGGTGLLMAEENNRGEREWMRQSVCKR